jgi:flagellar basal body-associated protein FliL
MAENEDTTAKTPAGGATDEAEGGGGSRMVLVLSAVALLAGAAAGYVAGGLLGGGARPAAAAPDEAPAGPSGPEYDYHEMEAVSGNLNDPQLGRVFKVTLRVKARKDVFADVEKALTEHLPELQDWLMSYFASCTVDEVLGGENRNRIRREIREAFNARLWPEGKPLIEEILFKEFYLQ